MNPIYQQALNGTLRTKPGEELKNAGFVNQTDIVLDLYWIGWDGKHWGYNSGTGNVELGYPPIRLAPGKRQVWGVSATNSYFLFNAAYSGAFMCVATSTASNQDTNITCDLLADPNDVGAIPAPNQDVIIPPDSPRVIVSCGVTPKKTYLTREQYWHRLSDSHTLAPGETREVSFTVFTGLQKTTSEQTVVAESVGVSASGGWGPISASVSASLSQTSSTFQQVTVTEERTSFVSDKLENKTDKPRMLLYWQLTDVVTVFDGSGRPLASIVSRNQPNVIGGPYDPNALPAPPAAVRITKAMRESVPQAKAATRALPATKARAKPAKKRR